MANRVEASIVALRPRFEQLDDKSRATVEAATMIEYDEWVIWKNTVAVAQASGIITYEEAVALQSALSSVEHFNDLDLVAKVVITTMVTGLLAWKRGLK